MSEHEGEFADVWKKLDGIDAILQEHIIEDARRDTKILGYEGNPNGSMLGDLIKLKAGVVWKDQIKPMVEAIVKEEVASIKEKGRSTWSKIREYAQTVLAVAALLALLGKALGWQVSL